jgi:hypothetical protein
MEHNSFSHTLLSLVCYNFLLQLHIIPRVILIVQFK